MSTGTGARTPATAQAAGDRFWAHRTLMAVCAGCAMAEAGLLLAVAPAASQLAPQVTAPPPLAVFHDLRWLFDCNWSWPQFAAGLVLLIAGRTVLSAVTVRLAWPRDLPPPGLPALLRAQALFTVVAGALLVPIATLLFGVALLPFSWPFLAAMPVMLAVALPLSHGGVVPGWWHRLPPPRAMAWALACFCEYSLASVLIARLPAAATVPLAGLAGLVNARAWYGLACAVARPSRRAARPLLTWIPVAPVAAVAVFAVFVGGAQLVFDTHAAPSGPGPAEAAMPVLGSQAATGTVTAAAQPVLVVAGFGSRCCYKGRSLQQAGTRMRVQQFSYLGLTASGRPIPQGSSSSDLPLAELGDMIAAQADELHQRTGRDVDIVAESEGTLGVYAMFARHPDVPVGSVVLLSPIVAPGQVTFPAAGQEGRGMVSGDALRALDTLVGGMSPFGRAGAQRLLSSVSAAGASYAAATRQVARKGTPRRWLAVVPLADAVTLPSCQLPGDVLYVPALHGGLLGDAPVLRTVSRFLAGHQVTSPQTDLRRAAALVSSAAAAWRLPESSAPATACTH